MSSVSISQDCRIKSSWTPRCLQELYGIPSTAATQTANVFGVSGFFNEFANKRDLQVSRSGRYQCSLNTEDFPGTQTFLRVYRPDMDPNTTFDFMSVDGGINNQLPAGAGLFVVSL
jgi:tripeptidyl-peptidase-1